MHGDDSGRVSEVLKLFSDASGKLLRSRSAELSVVSKERLRSLNTTALLVSQKLQQVIIDTPDPTPSILQTSTPPSSAPLLRPIATDTSSQTANPPDPTPSVHQASAPPSNAHLPPPTATDTSSQSINPPASVVDLIATLDKEEANIRDFLSGSETEAYQVLEL